MEGNRSSTQNGLACILSWKQTRYSNFIGMHDMYILALYFQILKRAKMAMTIEDLMKPRVDDTTFCHPKFEHIHPKRTISSTSKKFC